MALCAWIDEPHEIVLHEIKDEIEGALVLPKVHRLGFVRDDFLSKKKTYKNSS